MSTDQVTTPTEDLAREILDALTLLHFAIETGHKTDDGRSIAVDVIQTIRDTAIRTGQLTVNGAKPDVAGPMMIPSADIAAFEKSYYALAEFMDPVTVHTLRATQTSSGFLWFGKSQAFRFALTLWVVSLAFAGLTVGANWGLAYFGNPEEGEVNLGNTFMQLVELLIPFAYGGLGSCVYLLRSAHTYIYERTFDVRRMPEYYNRIILGTIGGGAIVLFVDHLVGEGGEAIALSAAALGFIGGYSTDFVFNSIERLIAALLPKVGLESVRKRTASASKSIDVLAGDLTLKELVERYESSTDDQRALYKSLIEKLRDRL
jgi:hypothetical protein